MRVKIIVKPNSDCNCLIKLKEGEFGVGSLEIFKWVFVNAFFRNDKDRKISNAGKEILFVQVFIEDLLHIKL